MFSDLNSRPSSSALCERGQEKNYVAHLIASVKKRNTKHLVRVRQKQTVADKWQHRTCYPPHHMSGCWPCMNSKNTDTHWKKTSQGLDIQTSTWTQWKSKQFSDWSGSSCNFHDLIWQIAVSFLAGTHLSCQIRCQQCLAVGAIHFGYVICSFRCLSQLHYLIWKKPSRPTNANGRTAAYTCTNVIAVHVFVSSAKGQWDISNTGQSNPICYAVSVPDTCSNSFRAAIHVAIQSTNSIANSCTHLQARWAWSSTFSYKKGKRSEQ